MNQPINPSGAGKVNRRTFLKSSSTAVAGGALLGALPVERFALGASPGDTLRLALIGCGGGGPGAAPPAPGTSGGGEMGGGGGPFQDPLPGGVNKLQKKHHHTKQENDRHQIN